MTDEAGDFRMIIVNGVQHRDRGQRGLAGVGVRDDRKGPPASNFVVKITHQSVSINRGATPLPPSAPPLYERWILWQPAALPTPSPANPVHLFFCRKNTTRRY